MYLFMMHMFFVVSFHTCLNLHAQLGCIHNDFVAKQRGACSRTRSHGHVGPAGPVSSPQPLSHQAPGRSNKRHTRIMLG